MAENRSSLTILLNTSLNTAQIIGSLNESIQRIERNPSLKRLSLTTNINQNTFTQITQITNQIQAAGEQTEKRLSFFGNYLSYLYKFLSAVTVMIIDVDRQVNGLRRAMNMDTDFDKILRQNIATAKELGRSLKEVNEAAQGMTLQGFKAEDAVVLAKTAVLMQNISELTPDESFEALNTAINAFNVEASHSIAIADKLNEVSGRYDVSTKDLTEALNTAGKTAGTYGVSLDQLLGHVTALTAATNEGGKEAGSGLKDIYSRLSTLSQSDAILGSVSVSVRNMNQEMRGAGDILEDLAGKWSLLSEEQRESIAVTIGGRTQVSNFMALMDNYSYAMEAARTSLSSNGSAFRENDNYMQSLEARISLVRTSWQDLSLTMGDAVVNNTMISLLQAAVSVGEGMKALIDKVGVLPVLFGATGMAAILLHANFRTAAASGNLLSAAFSGITITATAAKAAVRSFLASTLVGAGLAAIGFGLELIINKTSEVNEKRKEQEQQEKRIFESYRSQRTEVEKLLATYEELNGITFNGEQFASPAQEKEYFQITQQLGNLLPSLVEKIDEKGRTHLKVGQQLKQEIDYTRELTKAQAEQARQETVLDIKKNIETRNDLLRSVEKKKESIQNSETLITNYQNNTGAYRTKGSQTFYESEKKRLAASKMELVKLRNELSRTSTEAKSYFRSLLDLASTDKNITIAEEYKEQISKVIEHLDLVTMSEADFLSQSTLIIESLRSSESVEQFTSRLKEIYKDNPQVIQALSQISSTLNNSVKPQLVESGKQFETMREKMKSVFANSTAEVKDLNQVIYSLAHGQSLHASEVSDLLLKYPELAGSITKVGDSYKIELSALQAVRKAKVEKAIADLEAEKRSTTATLANSLARIRLYNIELKNIKSVEEAKQKIADLNKETEEENKTEEPAANALSPFAAQAKLQPTKPFPGVQVFLDQRQQKEHAQQQAEIAKKAQRRSAIEALQQYIQNNESLDLQIAELQRLVNDPNFGVTSSNKSTSVKENQLKEALEAQDATKQFIDTFNQEYQARLVNIRLMQEQVSLTEKLANRQKSAADKQTYFTQAIMESNQLLKQQRGAMDEIAAANAQLEIYAEGLRNRDDNAKLNTSKETNRAFFDAWFNPSGDASLAYYDYLNKLAEQSQTIHDNNSLTVEARNRDLDLLEDQKKAAELLFSQLSQLKQAWSANFDKIKEMTGDIGAAQESAERYAQSLVEARFTHSKDWIEGEKSFDRLSVQDEFNAWNRVLNNHADDNPYFTDLFEKIRSYEHDSVEAERQIQAIRDANAEKRKEAEKEIYQVQKDMQGKLKSNITEAIGQLSEAYAAYYDELLAAEDERHKRTSKNLNDELKQYEAVIRELTQSLDREVETERYQSDLTSKQQEAQAIQDQINKYQLDESLEGKAKQKELEQEYASKQNEIEKLKYDRQIALRKQNFDDLLAQKQKEIEVEQNKEDALYEANKATWEQKKKDYQLYWNNMLNNDAEYAKLQQDLLGGHVTGITTQMETLKTNISTQTDLIGQSISTNLIAKVEAALQLFNNLANQPYGEMGVLKQSSSSPANATVGKRMDEDSIIQQMINNSNAWRATSNAELRQKYEKANQELSKLFGPDAGISYSNGTWFKNGKPLYHQGGEVGVPGTSFDHWLDNLGSDEVSAILRKSEVVMNSPIQNIKSIIQKFMPDFGSLRIPAANTAVAGDTTIHLSVNIDKLTGDENGVSAFFNKIKSGMQLGRYK
ncbi:phage tail tape measure protein [Paenibacillus sp. y28]|uniref:phage tail tape measure protein n=1 Tax=Paenibacillus sp. y28 TaxID=3129110 RepID=UPI003015E3EA